MDIFLQIFYLKKKKKGKTNLYKHYCMTRMFFQFYKGRNKSSVSLSAQRRQLSLRIGAI